MRLVLSLDRFGNLSRPNGGPRELVAWDNEVNRQSFLFSTVVYLAVGFSMTPFEKEGLQISSRKG